MLKRIVVSVYATVLTVVPVLTALMPNEARCTEHDGVCSEDFCQLSDDEVRRLRAAMLGYNASCTFNMTLSSILSGD
eukprot:COSAG04_NODE_209_length_20232_cov_116.817315_18_plen_77_part_00